jgi:quinoprotein glucose dehydrogenase
MVQPAGIAGIAGLQMNRVLKLSILTVATAAATAILGGSGYRYLGGAHSLDIIGAAPTHDGEVSPPGEGWPSYGNDDGGHRYSSAQQISTGNVHELEVAWEYSSGDVALKADGMRRAVPESTPILVGDKLVYCTPFNDVVALHPGTGEERWRFNANIDLDQRPANEFICRGVAHWHDPGADGLCASTIFMGTNDARLIAIDEPTGQPCPGFGNDGEIRIDPGMDLLWPGEFQITSPPVVIDDIVVVGSSVSDNVRRVAPRGVIRAFDARSGEPAWEFDPIPRSAGNPDWQGAEAPVEGHANAWAPMSVDVERGLVFVPTSSPSPDFYGGLRPGDNRHANSVVALDARSGEVAWGFQLVHHDVFDYDLPAQPGLYSVWKDGESHDVVVQVTKTGHVFVLDRDTGEPFLPVEERQVPASDVPGEQLSPTQPFPSNPPALVPDRVDPGDAFGLTWFDKRACRKQLEGLRAEGLFTPPSMQGTLFLPFTGGGANWGGGAFDPQRNLLIINMSNLAHVVQLYPGEEFDAVRSNSRGDDVEPMRGTPYMDRRGLLMSPLGLPCTPPPWGIIAGVDLATGDIVWRRALGTLKDMIGIALPTGTPTFGGPIATSGDLVFIASTFDFFLRALSTETGEELWRGRLPTSGNATPMTYMWQGRQYVVINAGGSARAGTPPGDALIAFALPL